jgi:hypothetical protein
MNGSAIRPMTDDELSDLRAAVDCGANCILRYDVAALLARLDQAEPERDRVRLELRDKRNDLLDIRGILSPADGLRRVPPDVEMAPAAAPAVLWLANELDRVSSELARARRTA